jgi:hypothetical protein
MDQMGVRMEREMVPKLLIRDVAITIAVIAALYVIQHLPI